MSESSSAPWFEDFQVGDDFSDVPAVTITDAHNAIHQAIFGDRARLSIDHELSVKVTGSGVVANPSMVANVVIGQSTIPSQRVMGNLFYRGLVFLKPVFVGDTLTTRTEVVALRQNRKKEGRPASGMVALKIEVKNQHGEVVLDFFRCPMIPCRDKDADTGRQDDFAMMPEEISDETLKRSVPDWNLLPIGRTHSLPLNESILIEARDTVTLAPELVRLTLNMAMTHTDAARSVYRKRLVYGGHTIAIAAAQMSRLLPNLVTILAWFHCDHLAPVFEEDILSSSFEIERKIDVRDGVIAVIKVSTTSEGSTRAEEVKVLDWKVAVLVAGSL